MAILFGSVRHISGSRIPLGYQQILAATLASATNLTLPVAAVAAQYALIQVEGTIGVDIVRWRDDGVAPTATVGMQLGAMHQWEYPGDLEVIQFIVCAGAPILNVSYYH
jgi:hypothetical protein